VTMLGVDCHWPLVAWTSVACDQVDAKAVMMEPGTHDQLHQSTRAHGCLGPLPEPITSPQQSIMAPANLPNHYVTSLSSFSS